MFYFQINASVVAFLSNHISFGILMTTFFKICFKIWKKNRFYVWNLVIHNSLILFLFCRPSCCHACCLAWSTRTGNMGWNSLDLGLLVLFIFFNIQRFLHEKTGTRWSDASEKLEGLVDFPTTRPKLPWNCPGCEMPNYCVLKHIYLQFNSEFKPIQVK
jgi:hypothetical protein